MTQPKNIIPLAHFGGTGAARAAGTCPHGGPRPSPARSLALRPPGQSGAWCSRAAGEGKQAGSGLQDNLGGGRAESIASWGAAVRYPPPPSKNTRRPAHPSPCPRPRGGPCGGPSRPHRTGEAGGGSHTGSATPADPATSATPGRGTSAPGTPHPPRPREREQLLSSHGGGAALTHIGFGNLFIACGYRGPGERAPSPEGWPWGPATGLASARGVWAVAGDGDAAPGEGLGGHPAHGPGLPHGHGGHGVGAGRERPNCCCPGRG